MVASNPLFQTIQRFFMQDVRRVAQRFEVPVLCLIAITYFVLLDIHEIQPNWLKASFPYEWLIPSLITGFCGSLALFLYAEREGWKKQTLREASLFLVVVIFTMRWVADPKYLYFFFLLPASLLSLSFLPFLQDAPSEKLDKEHCFLNTTYVVQGFFSLLSGSILAAGGAGVIASVGYLFEFDVGNRIYSDIMLFSFVLFAPFYLLANLPVLKREAAVQDYPYPKGLAFIIIWLLCPLVLVYMAILYAYLIKALLLMTLPHGYLGWMVSSFGAVGILCYMLATPLAQKGELLPSLVCRYFFRALLFPVLLAGLAAYLRIEAYGVTEARYGLVLVILWLLVTSLHVGFTKQPSFQRMLMLLAVLLLLASAGWWSAWNVSVRSQTSQLYAALKEAGQLKDGKIIKAKQMPAAALRLKISSQIEFLYKHRETRLLADLAGVALKEIPTDNYSFAQDYVGRMLGWDFTTKYDLMYDHENPPAENVSEPPSFHFFTDTGPFALNHNSLIPVKGCDYLLSMDLSLARESDNLVYFLKERNPYPEIDFEIRLYPQSIAFGFVGNGYTEIPLLPLIEKLEKIETKTIYQRKKEEMMLKQKGSDLDITLQIERISGTKENNQPKIDNVKFIACIKELKKPVRPIADKNAVKAPQKDAEIQTEFILIQ
jgi:hypothetical protein